MRLRPKRCMFCRALPLPFALPGAGAPAVGFSVVMMFLVSKKVVLVRGCLIQ
jgi:hypothetical protein